MKTTRRAWALTLTLAVGLGLASIALAQEAAPVEVTEIVLGSQLENGVPTTPATQFSRSDGAVYCVVRLTNRSGAEGAVRVSFERAEGEPASRAGGLRLEFPARPRYRTVARTTTQRAAGSYRCVVRTDEGEVLSHADFTLTE